MEKMLYDPTEKFNVFKMYKKQETYPNLRVLDYEGEETIYFYDYT